MGKLTSEQLKAREEATPAETDFLREQAVRQLYLDAYGREVVDPTPMAPPIGYVRAPSIAEQIRAAIQTASHEAGQRGAETIDEANDFEPDDEDDPYSQWENEDEFELDPAMEMMLARASRPPEGGTSAASAPQSPSAGESPTSTSDK